MKEIEYFRIPFARNMLNESDVRQILITTPKLKITEEEVDSRICPIEFVPVEAFKKHPTIIAKSNMGGLVEFKLEGKRKVEIRKFFQTGTVVAIYVVVPGTERKKRTEPKTKGSAAYQSILAEIQAAGKDGTLTQL
ncbi:MAG: hypothetical protein PHG25_00470 [Candidatus Pacebacteria bacterium]|nr:hypothetical protein [Candidatus Paceibacterota bacterium]